MKHFFTKENLQALKQDIELVFVIGSTVQLEKRGKRFFGQCPFHQGEGLVVSPEKNLWFCYSGCKRGGSIVDWVAAIERVTIGGALSLLAQRYPFLATHGQLGLEGLNEVVPEHCDLLAHPEVLLQVVEHYFECLRKNKKAVRYLYGLGMSHSVTHDFKVGYCDGSLLKMLDQRRDDHMILTKELKKVGVVKIMAKSSLTERLDGCIVFPRYNEQGQCVQLFGRRIPQEITTQHMQLLAS